MPRGLDETGGEEGMSIPESFLVGHHGESEPSQAFDWSAVDGAVAPDPTEQADSVQEHQQTAMLRLVMAKCLAIIKQGATRDTAWARIHILAHALKMSGCKTQRELATKLGLTPARVCQQLNAVARSLDGKH